jgi:acyl-CoA hydrolase
MVMAHKDNGPTAVHGGRLICWIDQAKKPTAYVYIVKKLSKQVTLVYFIFAFSPGRTFLTRAIL